MGAGVTPPRSGTPSSLKQNLRRLFLHNLVGTEMSLHVLAYNIKRVIKLLGMAKTMKAMKLAAT